MRHLWTICAFLAAATCASGQEVMKHDDGTVTVRMIPASLTLAELETLVRTSSNSCVVRPLGGALLVRDQPARIAEMEKLAAAFDPRLEPVEIKIDFAWTEDSATVKRSIDIPTALGREFRGASQLEELYDAETMVHAGGMTITRRHKLTGGSARGKILRREGARIDLQITIDWMWLAAGKRFVHISQDVVLTLENGKARSFSALSSSDSLQVTVTATAK